MRTATTTKLTLTMLIGGLAFAMTVASCNAGDGSAVSSRSGGSRGSGGNSSSGGTTGSGGDTGSGGSSASGGSSSDGGSTGTGGASGVGGSSNTGGSSASGGSSGSADAAGGSSSDDGPTGTGGATTGGSSGSGGLSDSGGSSGDGGAVGSGGSTGAGGSTSMSCPNAIVPANGTNGGVTDFTDYSTTTGKWGSTSGLYGSVYSYAGPNSTMTATVDTTGKNLHLTGTVASGDYAGGGVSFNVCATVASFTQIKYSLAGSASGCDLQLQIKTFDQMPLTQTPPGGCDESAGTCYGFPALQGIPLSSTSTDVVESLSDFSGWTDADATQVVGMQWQFNASPSCSADVTVTNITFLP